MKKFVFGVFTLLAVGLFTNPLFAKYCEKVPECASDCRFMRACSISGRGYDIYNCNGSYAAVKGYLNECDNCRWDVKMNEDGKFFVGGEEC